MTSCPTESLNAALLFCQTPYSEMSPLQIRQSISAQDTFQRSPHLVNTSKPDTPGNFSLPASPKFIPPFQHGTVDDATAHAGIHGWGESANSSGRSGGPIRLWVQAAKMGQGGREL
jgi:hypothetical protein